MTVILAELILIADGKQRPVAGLEICITFPVSAFGVVQRSCRPFTQKEFNHPCANLISMLDVYLVQRELVSCLARIEIDAGPPAG